MTDLLQLTTKRESRLAVRCRVKRLGRQLARVKRRYDGGLAAERQSYERLRQETALAIRRELLAHVGRAIDLAAVIKEQRPDGLPRWTVVDPRQPIGSCNGMVESDGTCRVGGRYLRGADSLHLRFGNTARRDVLPGGIPPLPAKVRSILGRTGLLGHATHVGILYQPEEWTAAHPDPALVVEWSCLPGQYFALAVWGPDRPHVMEFVS
jgi:hypothetical protein